MTQWIEPQPLEVPPALRGLIPTPGDLGTLIAELLVRRGINDAEIAKGFLDPAAYQPAPPEVLPDLRLVVERLEQALARNERIAVWGDFDVDGQTATALYVQALRDLGGNVSFRIPTRQESHGLHLEGVRQLIGEGVQLILTADTGVDAHAAVDLAGASGVDVLITDHHDLPEALPNARGVVNPKRLPDDHPMGELPGVGVAYQVVRSLYEEMALPGTERFLDLVALGIVADVATVVGDVRYLLQLGLDALRRTERPGLQAVMALSDLNPDLLSEEDIGFSLAPRLNALSRVGEAASDSQPAAGAEMGVELLTTGDVTRARTIATALEALNARRKWLTRQTLESALSQLEKDPSLLEGPAIVLQDELWDPGVVGIVAGRLAEQFNKPAIVFSAPLDEMARGSARSIEGVDIHAAIAAQQAMLHRSGGHPMAAGLSLPRERIGEFRRALWRTLARMSSGPTERQLEIDAFLAFDQLEIGLARAVRQVAPFGPGNERPLFATTQLQLVSSAVIGRTREHRRVVVRDAEQREQTVLWWHSADQEVPGAPFDLAYHVGINTFRGEQTVQLTWVEARSRQPPTVEVAAQPTLAVRDYRELVDPLPVLLALATGPGHTTEGPSVVIWAERMDGGLLSGLPQALLRGRTALYPADTLIIWTAPPGPGELRDAMDTVSPKEIVLFGHIPNPDTPQTFLTRLAGLAKHAIQKRGGQASLPQLAARMAHSEPTVRLGLEWLAKKGQLEYALDSRGYLSLNAGHGRLGEPIDVIQGQLRGLLEETSAYRSYFRRANASRVVRAEEER